MQFYSCEVGSSLWTLWTYSFPVDLIKNTFPLEAIIITSDMIRGLI